MLLVFKAPAGVDRKFLVLFSVSWSVLVVFGALLGRSWLRFFSLGFKTASEEPPKLFWTNFEAFRWLSGAILEAKNLQKPLKTNVLFFENGDSDHGQSDLQH